MTAPSIRPTGRTDRWCGPKCRRQPITKATARLTTKQINHDPARTFMNCGTQISGRPYMGSWISGGVDCRLNDFPNLLSIARHPDRPTRGVEMAVVIKKCFAEDPVRFLVSDQRFDINDGH